MAGEGSMERRLEKIEEIVIRLAESNARNEGVITEIHGFMERQTAAIEKTSDTLAVVAEHAKMHEEHTLEFQRSWKAIDEVNEDLGQLEETVQEHTDQLAVGRPFINFLIKIKDNFLAILSLGVTIALLSALGIDRETINEWLGK